MREGFKPS